MLCSSYMQLSVFMNTVLNDYTVSSSVVFYFISLPYLDTGDPTNLRIDLFAYSPELHSLVIAFNTTAGGEGDFTYNFTGQVRQRKLNCNSCMSARSVFIMCTLYISKIAN